MPTQTSKKKRTTIVISCIYDKSSSSSLPIGFSWANTLVTQFKDKYKVIVLLHGECLKYGLKSEVYKQHFGTPNPFAKFLAELKSQIVICNLCLHEKGFNSKQLLPFVKPIPFSI